MRHDAVQNNAGDDDNADDDDDDEGEEDGEDDDGDADHLGKCYFCSIVWSPYRYEENKMSRDRDRLGHRPY